jgi:hypothetical protein
VEWNQCDVPQGCCMLSRAAKMGMINSGDHIHNSNTVCGTHT